LKVNKKVVLNKNVGGNFCLKNKKKCGSNAHFKSIFGHFFANHNMKTVLPDFFLMQEIKYSSINS
jgi:hypothetical protein